MYCMLTSYNTIQYNKFKLNNCLNVININRVSFSLGCFTCGLGRCMHDFLVSGALQNFECAESGGLCVDETCDFKLRLHTVICLAYSGK